MFVQLESAVWYEHVSARKRLTRRIEVHAKGDGRDESYEWGVERLPCVSVSTGCLISIK